MVPNLVWIALDLHGFAPHVASLSDVHCVFRAWMKRQFSAALGPEVAVLYGELLGHDP